MACKDKRKRDRKRAILGMGFGAARGKLYRKLVRKLFTITHGMECGICGRKIKNTEPFHVDHKGGWSSLEEYLDISKVRPAHVKCNTQEGGLSKHYSKEEVLKKILESGE